MTGLLTLVRIPVYLLLPRIPQWTLHANGVSNFLRPTKTKTPLTICVLRTQTTVSFVFELLTEYAFRRKLRRVSDHVDEAMPAFMINAPVPPPPRLLHPGGWQAQAQEDDYLARLADDLSSDVRRTISNRCL